MKLPSPDYVNKMKKKTKRKWLGRIIPIANERLSKLRDFLDINEDYRSAALESLENETYKGFEFGVPRKNRDLRQIGAAYDRMYSRAYDFLSKKSSTIEGIKEIENDKEERMKSIFSQVQKSGAEEISDLEYSAELMGDFDNEEIEEMKKTLKDMGQNFDNWKKEDKNRFWKYYKDFKDTKAVAYTREDSSEYQSLLMAAMLAGADNPVENLIDYLNGDISYRELLEK